MKITVVSPYGKNGEYSGPEVLLGRLFARVSLTHDVRVLTTSWAAPAGGYSFAQSTTSIMVSHDWSVRAQLEWAVKTFVWLSKNTHRGQDVVHLHGTYLFNLLPAFALQSKGVDYVLMPLAANGDLATTSKSSRFGLLRRIRHRLVSRACLGFALAPEIASELAGLGLAKNRIRAIGNPVDIVEYAPGVIARAQDTVVFVGKIGVRKRPGLILEALALLKQSEINARAIFIGPYEHLNFAKAFKTKIRELDLVDAVDIIGFTSEVAPFLASGGTVFVLPSSQEGLPGALIEAMSSGLPCIVTDVGSMGDVINKARAGSVIPPDAMHLANTLARLWDDEHAWAQQSKAARAYAVANFSLEAVANEYNQSLSTNTSAKVATRRDS